MIAGDGDIGIGTASPAASVHVRRAGAAFIELENTAATTGDGWTINHSNPGALVMDGDASAADGGEFSLTVDGELTLQGDLITGGSGNCAPPNPACDGVFLPDYDVPSIEEHAAQMWQNQYLPAIGPTLPNEPINVSRKTQGILNELEHAHIYIEQLHKRLKALEAKLAEMEEK